MPGLEWLGLCLKETALECTLINRQVHRAPLHLRCSGVQRSNRAHSSEFHRSCSPVRILIKRIFIKKKFSFTYFPFLLNTGLRLFFIKFCSFYKKVFFWIPCDGTFFLYPTVPPFLEDLKCKSWGWSRSGVAKAGRGREEAGAGPRLALADHSNKFTHWKPLTKTKPGQDLIWNRGFLIKQRPLTGS